MRTIFPAASIFKKIVGGQKNVIGQGLRLMDYVIQCPVEDGVLLYHTLTCCLLLLSSDEVAHLAEHQELIDNWFLVPEEHDDRRFCQQVRQLASLFKPYGKDITHYTILTTTGCNARCYYCYERGTTPVRMTSETAEKVSQFILKHHGVKEIKLSWFGGEPLFNARAIDQICSTLKQHGVPFRSTMISNGYLFDTELISRAKNRWRLEKVQITLDGTEQTYNRVKNYIHGDVNAFGRVLGNIELLTANDIQVLVRLNVDKHNIEEMHKLVSLLHQRFGANEHLTVYSHELLGKRTPEENAELYELRMGLERQIADSGYRRKRELQKDLKLNNCMADNDQSVVITPTGNLGKCEHYVDREFFGHIDREERDESVILKFKERPSDIEACASCPCYPQCFRLLMCDNGVDCTPERKKERIYNTIEAMKDEYQKYLTNHAHDTEI